MSDEALEKATRDKKTKEIDKKAVDARLNRDIATEQKKINAILEEIDMIKSGRQGTLPFSERDWTKDDKDESRDANV